MIQMIDYNGPSLQTAFILGVELVGTPYRVFCGIFIEYFFVLGEAYLVAFAYLTRYYHPLLCVILYAWKE